MTHPERVKDYLVHIADAIERAIRYVGNLDSLAEVRVEISHSGCADFAPPCTTRRNQRAHGFYHRY
jgi:hypothetical protein